VPFVTRWRKIKSTGWGVVAPFRRCNPENLHSYARKTENKDSYKPRVLKVLCIGTRHRNGASTGWGVVKPTRLKTLLCKTNNIKKVRVIWPLSAFNGSNPFPCITKKITNKISIKKKFRMQHFPKRVALQIRSRACTSFPKGKDLH
jgi:hypothetical protein